MTNPGPLGGKRVVLGVCGGIAAYKAAALCRRMIEAGAVVCPVLTPGAKRFVGAATFAALASEPARTSMFGSGAGPDPVPHVALGRSADAVVVAPATARLIGAYAAGISSDLLSATLLVTRAPVLVCPSMHTEMWEHPAVQENIALLRRRGVHVLEPAEGPLAGGDTGRGRLPEPEEILAALSRLLSRGSLTGLRAVVSAGGTREPIDAVRYVGNRSSGKQGHAIARELADRGAEVLLVTASDLPVPAGVRDVLKVETAAEMADAVLAAAGDAAVVVMAAAVSDFRPSATVAGKWRKAGGPPSLELVPTLDILAELGARRRPGQVLVGFAAEAAAAGELAELGRVKLAAKGADLIVANDVSAQGAGFGEDRLRAVMVSPGSSVDLGLVEKGTLAVKVADAIEGLMAAGATFSDAQGVSR
ncbi:MAG TPA: bifunctional phosphopantothenoylcysteine decarboxylase/phosphopantothenate--cysteine ligase CoaBC [Acidimicrobiales bacterium]|nr:bifunctional phosphopantothenoylcysteine decarboxylase/phosphopantothenate--cysteine ligase CoaBC [Acidimicrobiales bacterium]